MSGLIREAWFLYASIMFWLKCIIPASFYVTAILSTPKVANSPNYSIKLDICFPYLSLHFHQKTSSLFHQSYRSKTSALASLKSGNKVSARRHASELKVSSERREKCDVLLRRVEEVLRATADAEDSKEVFEAIKSGKKAMKDKMITIEEVQQCLDDLDETITSQKQVEKVLRSVPPSYEDFDEDIEDELDKLMEESRNTSADGAAREHETSGAAESLSNTVSALKLADNDVTVRDPTEISNVSKVLELAPS